MLCLKRARIAEKPFLFDNSASGPSNRGHRFADANQSLTYRFDLPDTVTNANLVVDMANNFVVSLSGESLPLNYFNVATVSPEEANYLVDAGGSSAGSDFPFADGNAYMIYQFDLPDDVTKAFANVRVGNEFVIEAAAGAEGEFQVEKDWVARRARRRAISPTWLSTRSTSPRIWRAIRAKWCACGCPMGWLPMVGAPI